MISGAARIAGIVGWPVAQSLSPRLHGYWLAELGLDGAVVPLAVRPEDFTLVLDGLRRAGFAGVNVTVPHKEAAFAVAHQADAAARAAGAANLLVFRDGRILARNTDASGLKEALGAALGPGALAGKAAVLLGAGGAARGAVIALEDCATIHVLNRSPERAAALAGALQPMVAARLVPGGLEDWPGAARDAALLVNATSAGMNGKSPLALDLSALPQSAAVCDMVYKPLKTALLASAEARGLQAIDGLGMLMHQAAPSFEAFFGVRPPVTPGLRACLEDAL